MNSWLVAAPAEVSEACGSLHNNMHRMHGHTADCCHGCGMQLEVNVLACLPSTTTETCTTTGKKCAVQYHSKKISASLQLTPSRLANDIVGKTHRCVDAKNQCPRHFKSRGRTGRGLVLQHVWCMCLFGVETHGSSSCCSTLLDHDDNPGWGKGASSQARRTRAPVKSTTPAESLA